MTRRFLVAVVVVLLTAAFSLAGSYRVGYIDTNGYQFGNDGYWHYNGNAYYRYASESPGYWSCGVYYPGSISYSYKQYVPPAVAVVPVVPAYSEGNWKQDLLKYARQRQDYEEYVAAVKLLGLAQPQPYAAQQAIYNQADLLQLYQMANQHVLGAQKLASDGQSGFQQLVALDGANRAEIARIVAKRDLAIAILQSLNGPNSIINQGYTITIGSGGGITKDDSKVNPDTKTKNLEAWKALAQAKCATCHTGKDAKGGFDVSTYPSLSQANK
jgi:mono/diheme cytochrome c family protein